MNILVTGGCGFVGSHLSRFLCSQESVQHVVCFDLPSVNREGMFATLPNGYQQKIQVVFGDIASTSHLERVLNEYSISHVVHLAALAGVRESVGQFEEYFNTNVAGARKVFDACVKANVQLCIAASSSTVYGDSNSRECNQRKLLPKSPYGWSKLLMELAMPESSRCVFAGLRLFSVYGWPCHRNLFLPNVINACAAGAEFMMSANQSFERDFTHVEDVCETISLLLTKPPSKNLICDVGAGRGISLRCAIKLVERFLNKKVKIRRAPISRLDALATLADNRAIESLTCKRSWISIEDGLEKICKTVLANGLPS